MTRQNATNFTAPLQFPYATAGTDVFMKEDVQILAQAVDQHNHTTGKGLPIAAGAIPNGSITSAMIADGTIQGADIATGAITTTQIADGTIATADLANQAVTNAKLGTDTARLNLLTNGGFEIWQRGNGPFSVPSGGGVVPKGADMWSPQLATGAGNITITKETTTIDVASSASAKVVYTAGAGDAAVCAYEQLISAASDIAAVVRGKTLSFSVRVNASAAGRVRAFYADGVNGGGNRIFGSYNATSNAWETLTLACPIAASPAYLYIGIDILLGQTTTFYVDNAMLVVGSVAADYAPLHPADDLARCLRYYQRWDDANTEIGMGASQNTTSHIILLPLAAGMAITPSLTTSPVANLLLQNSTLTGSVAPSAVAASTMGKRVCSLSATTGAAFNTAGSPVFLYTNTGWIAMEANP